MNTERPDNGETSGGGDGSAEEQRGAEARAATPSSAEESHAGGAEGSTERTEPTEQAEAATGGEAETDADASADAEVQAAGLTGFRLRPAVLGHDLPAITRGLVPELQRRGAFRTAYEADTLRGLLGLDRPANRYAASA